MMIFLPLPQG